MMCKYHEIPTTLVKGRDGMFEVTLDGELIFSKKSLGRFPEPGEVAAELEKRVA